jgi:integrase
MVLFLTLVRRGLLARAEWTEFDFDRKEWRIPAKQDKERRSHVVPLTDWAIEHLLALKKLSKSSIYVLPKQRKGKGERPCNAQIISRSVFRLRERFQAIGIAPFTPHDIRRTGRTCMGMLDVDERVAERALNHSMGEIVETYDLWEYVPQKRVALERLGSYYASLLSREAPSPAARDLIRLWNLGRRKTRGAKGLRASESVEVGLEPPAKLKKDGPCYA